LGIFLITTASRTVLGSTQPPIQWVFGAVSLGVKWLGREADHSPPSSAEIKECVELYLHSLSTSSWRGALLSTGTTLPFTDTINDNFNFNGAVICDNDVLIIETKNKIINEEESSPTNI
jgi:hypothetical protein